mgnify:CR=1 FL=1
MYYIEETDKPNFFEEKFLRVKLEVDKIILPMNVDKLNPKKTDILAKKTLKILEKANSKKVVISKNIQNIKEYTELIKKSELEIIDGKWLYKILTPEILEYILNKENIRSEETNLYILINDLTEIALQTIKRLANTYKSINIITNHIEKFKKIEETMAKELGIAMTVMNNKKKGLAKAKMILNFDFPKELLNKYNIYEKAIIVNLQGNIKIAKKGFEGIVINDYEIEIVNPQEYHLEDKKYKIKELYEACFYKSQPYNNIVEKIKKDKVKIKELYSLNGII